MGVCPLDSPEGKSLVRGFFNMGEDSNAKVKGVRHGETGGGQGEQAILFRSED